VRLPASFSGVEVNLERFSGVDLDVLFSRRKCERQPSVLQEPYLVR